jgi:hypothetical protein
MCRWSRFSETTVVDMQVVVYDGRPNPIAISTGNANPAPQGGYTIPVERAYIGGGVLPAATAWPAPTNQYLAFQRGSNTAVIRQTPNQPWPAPVKRGDWVLDNTMLVPSADTAPPTGSRAFPLPLVNGFFYKVVGVSDPYTSPVTGLAVQDLQLDRPARVDGFAPVILQGVVNVINKSDGRRPSN